MINNKKELDNNIENTNNVQQRVKKIKVFLATAIIVVLVLLGYREAKAANYVAKAVSSGGTYYFDNLQDACNNAVWFGGGTVYILQDIVTDSISINYNPVTIKPEGGNWTITHYDFDGSKDYDGTRDGSFIGNNANLTAVGEQTTISISGNNGYTLTLNGNGVENTVKNNWADINIYSGVNVINSGYSLVYTDTGTLNIYGGTFNGNNGIGAYGIHTSGTGTINISGGTFYNNICTVVNWGGSTNITGGHFYNCSSDIINIGKSGYSAKLKITGGTFYSGNRAVRLLDGASGTISGGTFRNNTTSNVNVTGGSTKLTVSGGNFYSSTVGIYNEGIVSFTGGNVHSNTWGVWNTGTYGVSGGNYYSNTYGIITAGTLNMTGGNIYSNTDSGLYINGGAFNVASNFAVNTNNRIWLSSSSYINVTGALNNSTVGVITPEAYNLLQKVVQVSYSGATGATVLSKFSLTPNGTYQLLNFGTTVNITANYALYVNPNGGAFSNGVTSTATASPRLIYATANWCNVSGFVPTRTGYTFNGFYTAASGGTKVYNANGTYVAGTSYWNTSSQYVYASDLTIYAQWTPNTYTIKFVANQPTIATATVGGSTASQTHTYDSAKALTTNGFTLTGWTFTGWNTKADGTGTSYSNGQSVKNLKSEQGATLTLYAQWRQNTYTIKYSGNDTTTNIYGDVTTTKYDTSTSTASTSCKYDSDVTLAVNGFSKEGYIFKGWNTKSDGTGAMYSSGQTLTKPNFTSTNNGSITLYAIWEPITYTIKFHSNDDSLGNWNTTDSYTQTNVRFDQPTKLTVNQFTRTAPFTLSDNTQLSEGYQFIGWSNGNKENTKNLIADQATVTSLTSTNDGTVNLYATWQKDLTLMFNPNTGTYKDVANDINTKQPITLSASIYNSQYTYTFNIDNGTTPAKNNYYTVQTGKIKAYGTSTGTKKASTLVNGENSILTKFTTDGTNYRFLGWNFSPSQIVPNTQFDVFADGSIKPTYNTRTSNYPIYDDTTLYAIWEPILTVSIDLDRVLGSLNANETNSLESIKTSDGKQTIDLTIRAGEQAQYKIATTGHKTKQLQVLFDSRITDIYTHGDKSSPWKDTLNTLADLNKTINPLTRNYSTKFFIPMYLGTTSSYDTSNPTIAKDTDDYTTVFEVYQDSYYYETYKGIKEQVQVTANIHLKSTNTSEGDDNTDTDDKDPIDSIIKKLKARLKIKLNF